MTNDISHPTATFSWADTDRMTRDLAARINADHFSPDAIVAILRGGCVPAVHLAHLLRVRPFHAVHLQTTVSDEIRAARQSPHVLAHTQVTNLTGKRVLLVDDVTNTGLTLATARAFIEQLAPAELHTAVLVWDTLSPPGHDPIEATLADYWVEKAHAWAVFPWCE